MLANSFSQSENMTAYAGHDFIKVRLPPVTSSASTRRKSDAIFPISPGAPATPPRDPEKLRKAVSFVDSMPKTPPPTTIISPNDSPSSTGSSMLPTAGRDVIIPCQTGRVPTKSDTSTSLPSTFFSSLPSGRPYGDFPFGSFLQSILLSSAGIIARYPFDPDPLATIEQILNWRDTETVLGLLIRMLETCRGFSVMARLQTIFLMSYASKALLIRIACVLSTTKDPSKHSFWFERFVDAMEAHFTDGVSEFKEFAQDELDELETAFKAKFPSHCGITELNMRSNANVVICPHPHRVEWTSDLEEIEVPGGGIVSGVDSDMEIVESEDDAFWA